MSEQITYSKFRLATPDDAALEAAPREPFPLVPSSEFRIVTLIDEPAVQVVYEDWFKDNDVEWVYWLDAVHIVVGGEAEITYWDGPNWEEAKTALAGPGAIFLTPRACRARWRVLSEEPFRRIVLDIPNGGYTTPDAAAA